MQPRQGMAERTTEEDHIKSMYHPHAVLLPESGQSLKKIFFSTKKKKRKTRQTNALADLEQHLLPCYQYNSSFDL